MEISKQKLKQIAQIWSEQPVNVAPQNPKIDPKPYKSRIVLRRSLFAAMQASSRASADPSAFASSLNLDNSIQQVLFAAKFPKWHSN